MAADALRRLPTWVWLTALVLCSFALRAWLARGMPAPFIMVDELIYAELARSFAERGEFLVRGVPAYGYSLVYPALVSPAYLLFERLPDAYAAVKTINALLMSLAAVPAYLLARRVLRPAVALLAALLALALPSLVYTGTEMTENAFYPVFLAACLSMAAALERPTAAAQLAALAAIGVAYATRVQAVVLVPALLAAPALLALFRRERLAAALRPYRLLYGTVAGLAALAALVQVARGRSLTDLAGAYRVVGDAGYDPAQVLRYLLYHAAELDLYLGIVPVAAAAVLAGRARSLDRPLQALLALTLAVSFFLLLAVAAFASVFAHRIQERNTFVLAPLYLVLLLAWAERGAPRPRLLAPAAAVGAAALVAAIPFERFIETSAISDTLMLLPWWSAQDHVTLEWVAELALLLAAGLAALFLAAPGRVALALPLAVLAYYAACFHPVWAGPHGLKQASAGALFQGIRGVPRDWIDEAVPEGAEVSVLWTGRADRFTVNQNEFFNRAVGDVFYTSRPTPGGIGETPVRVDPRSGTLRLPDGRPLVAEYLLADGSLTPDGRVVARDDPLGTTLWRIGGEVVSTTTVRGLYPNDTWSGAEVVWTRRRCRGGELRVSLSSDPSLFRAPQTVAAFVHGREAARLRLAPAGRAVLRVPLPDGEETCLVRFRVRPTAVPAQVLDGSADGRVLGAHFNGFDYRPVR